MTFRCSQTLMLQNVQRRDEISQITSVFRFYQMSGDEGVFLLLYIHSLSLFRSRQ
jgi:hypothetical protein